MDFNPNWVALIVASLSTLVVGFIWYNPKVFGTIWMNEIGRYQGSQISILKTIIKASSYLIKEQTKTILFVIKDYTEDADKGILKD